MSSDSLPRNPLHLPLDTLFRRLTELNGFLNYIDNGLGQFKTYVEGEVTRGPTLIRALMLQDLSESEWSVPIGIYSLRGDSTYQFYEQVKSANAAWALAQAYDAFEGCLREVAITYFRHYPSDINTNDLDKFNAKFEKPLDATRDDSIASFVRFTYRKNTRILATFRKIAPELDKWERRNPQGLNFQEWHKIVKCVRDAIVHAQGKIQKLDPKSQHKILTAWFSGIYKNDEYALRIATNEATRQLELTACYAFLIFKALSAKNRLEWNLYNFPVTS